MPSTVDTEDRTAEGFRTYHRRRAKERHEAREALRQKVLAEAKEAVSSLAPEFPALREIHLFGSILQPGRFTEKSDVDLAVDTDRGAEDPFEQESRFWRAMEEALRRNVDLRPLEHHGIRRIVDRDGERVYAR